MQSAGWVHKALWVPKVKVILWPWSRSLWFNIFKLLFLNNHWFKHILSTQVSDTGPMVLWFTPPIPFEPCMLGSQNFIYGFYMEKCLTRIFSVQSYHPFWSSAPFKKMRWKSCQQVISKSIWARALIFEPWHDKTNKVTVRPAKTEVSLSSV